MQKLHGEGMKHIVGKKWKSGNKSRRIDIIMEALNLEGMAEVKYFTGRSCLTKMVLGRGTPQPVKDTYLMNQLEITYQQKDAVLLYFTRVGVEGQLFDENFSEQENLHIENALSEAGIFTWREYYVKQNAFRRYLYIGMVGIGCFYIFNGYFSKDSFYIFTGIALVLFNLVIFLYK
jgi:hypothetical protein